LLGEKFSRPPRTCQGGVRDNSTTGPSKRHQREEHFRHTCLFVFRREKTATPQPEKGRGGKAFPTGGLGIFVEKLLPPKETKIKERRKTAHLYSVEGGGKKKKKSCFLSLKKGGAAERGSDRAQNRRTFLPINPLGK